MKKTVVNGFSLNEPETKTEPIKEMQDFENAFYEVIDGTKKVKTKELFDIITTVELGGNPIETFF